MISKLAEWGLVAHEKYKGTVVTDEGEGRARAAVEPYCVIQRFLHTVLEVNEYRSEARSIEAVLDPRVAERLDTLIDRHGECPDCFDGTIDRCECLELAETVDFEEIPSPGE